MLDPQFSPETPARKPFSIVLIQLAVFLIALSPLALVPLMYADSTYHFETWAEHGPGDTATQYMLEHAYVELGCIGVGVLLLLGLAIASTVGLHKGKRSGRTLTAIWVGIMVAGSAAWFVWVWLWHSSLAQALDSAVETTYSGAEYYIDAVEMNIPVAGAVFALSLLVFILVLTPGVRRWTPKRQQVAVVGQQMPAAPAQFGPPQQGQFPPAGQRQQ